MMTVEVRKHSRTAALSTVITLLIAAASTHAQPRIARTLDGDVYEINVQSHTYLELYRRALLPGPDGALVVTDTVAPLYEYVAFRASSLDLPFRRDGLDVELNAWGRLEFADIDGTRRLDGDLGAANVRYRDDHVSLKLGRQHHGGGAARYVRFDGVSGAARLDNGLGLEAYGGFAVPVPTYRRRGYLLLGAVSESTLRARETYEDAEAGSSWLAGARAFYERSTRHGASISFHEQRGGGELERRNFGVDAHASVTADADLLASAVLDVDSQRLADARMFADYAPGAGVDLGLEYLHAEPSLFLSRQSVLSVFSTDQFDQVGARASVRLRRAVELSGSAHGDRYDGGELGSRTELGARFRPGGDERLSIGIAYGRVVAPDNGYHSARLTARARVARPLAASAELHHYVYDDTIAGYASSSIGAGTLEYSFAGGFALLWGASLARSPYAELDAQTLVRLSYELSLLGGPSR